MFIESIELSDYRNYSHLHIDFHKGTNVLYGDNAQGKTNILEAVYVCSTTKSHRGSKDKEIIRFGADESHIKMMVRRDGIPYRIDMHLKKNKAKGVAVNGVPIKKASELFGIVNVIFFSPEDLNIIKNGPGERRRFLDMELCQLDSIYLFHLSNYNKLLLQRNRLLKDYGFYPEAGTMLDVMDEQLIQYGTALIRSRRAFTDQLQKIIGGIHSSLSGRKEDLTVTYEPNAEETEFGQKLQENREKDLRMKQTMTGPHRDDLGFAVHGVDLRKYGSQGQQRTTALSLKLAEIEIVKQSVKDTPVLLLDDVLSELDGSRQRYLLENIHDIQTMITCTGVDDFVENNFQIDRLFQVVEGTVERRN